MISAAGVNAAPSLMMRRASTPNRRWANSDFPLAVGPQITRSFGFPMIMNDAAQPRGLGFHLVYDFLAKDLAGALGHYFVVVAIEEGIP